MELEKTQNEALDKSEESKVNEPSNNENASNKQPEVLENNENETNEKLEALDNNEDTSNKEEEVIDSNEDESNEEEKKPTNPIIKWTKRILGWIGSIILALLLIVTGWLAIDKFILKNPVPSIFGRSSLIVATGSMNGTINEGDMIIIKKTDDYKLWDIVTFLQEGDEIPTTHRIVKVNPDGTYITKGDANDSNDTKPVSKDEILGEVIQTEDGKLKGVIPKVGIFVGWVKSGGGLIYILSFIGILGVGIYLLTQKD